MGPSAPAGGGAQRRAGDRHARRRDDRRSRRSWPVVRTSRPPVYYVPLQPFTPGASAPRPHGEVTGGVSGRLSFDPEASAGGWADLPPALARLHLGSAVGAAARCTVPGRYPHDVPPLPELVNGAGFLVERARRVGGRLVVDARRDRTLPDFVGGGMRILVCGLNPSLVAADAGFGFAGATNRFWSAAVAAGVVTRPRQPLVSLAEDGVGMTDLVKRATRNADSLTAAEYQAGAERVRRLVEWLRPGVVVSVGLAGWRAAVDRRAVPGRQSAPFGGVPAYVMPSTSGRNARTSPADLAAHLRRAAALASSPEARS